MFLAEVRQDDKNQLLFINPKIIDIIEGANTISLPLASKLSRNMSMFAKSYSKGNHCFFKGASLPTLTLATILEMVNYNWCKRSFDDDPVSL